MQVPKILIVGCGITGGSVYHFLTKLFNYPKECFTFWEDSKYIGGRMRKIRFQNSQCDVGAQYITKFSNNFDDVYSVLTSNRILVPFTSYIEGTKDDHFSKSHFVSARGLSSIVEYFLQDLSNENQIQYQTRLQELDVVDTGGFVATSLSHNELKQQFFDIVIITISKSSVYEIKGNFRNFVNPIFFDQLDSIRYSSRFALCVFYDAVHSIHLENIPWTAKYVYDDDVIRYISIENRKHKGEEAILENSAPLSLLVHSSVPFGIENMNTEPEAVLLIMMQHLVKIFPMLENIAPSDTNLVFWKDSQVSTGLKWNDSKSAVFKLSSSHLESPSLLGFAGDYFTQSNFEGCLTSSRDIALSIHQTLCGDK